MSFSLTSNGIIQISASAVRKQFSPAPYIASICLCPKKLLSKASFNGLHILFSTCLSSPTLTKYLNTNTVCLHVTQATYCQAFKSCVRESLHIPEMIRRPSARIISPLSTRVLRMQVTLVGALSASSITNMWPSFAAFTCSHVNTNTQTVTVIIIAV